MVLPCPLFFTRKRCRHYLSVCFLVSSEKVPFDIIKNEILSDCASLDFAQSKNGKEVVKSDFNKKLGIQ